MKIRALNEPIKYLNDQLFNTHSLDQTESSKIQKKRKREFCVFILAPKANGVEEWVGRKGTRK